MAEKKEGSNSREKGAAFGKWVKIDKAQRNMFIAVCVASVVLGVTAVFVVYFIKVMTFNGTLIGEKDKVIASLKTNQSNLDSLSEKVNELQSNEYLESVARTRSTTDCSNWSNQSSDADFVDNSSLAKTCSSLRVIPDALPSLLNTDANLASLNQLLLWSSPSIGLVGLSSSDIEYDFDFSEDDVDESEESEDSEEENAEDDEGSESSIAVIGSSVTVEDNSENVLNMLATIEKSIRNYDLISASLEYDDDSYNLNGTFVSYYLPTTKLTKLTKKVCADETNEKCTGGSD